MGLGRVTSNLVIHSNLHQTNQPTRWLVLWWSTFGARTSHGPNLGEATTFPHIVYSTPLHEGHIQMAFCPRIPEGES
jgi:hypothetical protein